MVLTQHIYSINISKSSKETEPCSPKRIVRDAKPGPKTHILWDSTVKGLGLRITPKGVKSYILNYRINSRERRATIARASEISLKIARERAGGSTRCASGRGKLTRSKASGRRKEAPTVADGLRRFFDEFAPARLEMGRLSPRTDFGLPHGRLERFLEPALGRRKVADVTSATT